MKKMHSQRIFTRTALIALLIASLPAQAPAYAAVAVVFLFFILIGGGVPNSSPPTVA